MNKEFIPYEQALELKELGFDESCFGFYTEEYKNLIENVCKYPINLPTKPFLAPTFSQAFRWFREKHNLKFHIREDNWNNWCSVYILISDEHERVGDYLTYEEAELACLNKLIEIVKNKQNEAK